MVDLATTSERLGSMLNSVGDLATASEGSSSSHNTADSTTASERLGSMLNSAEDPVSAIAGSSAVPNSTDPATASEGSSAVPNSTDPATASEGSSPAATSLEDLAIEFIAENWRDKPLEEYINAFNQIWSQDHRIAIKLLLHQRDYKTGNGLILLPCIMLICLKTILPLGAYAELLEQILQVGCWKDALRIIEIQSVWGIDCTNSVEIQLFAKQLRIDIAKPDTEAVSLCGKWAPSEGTHFDRHPMCIASKIAEAMELNPKQYRQMLTVLRKRKGVLETMMATKQYAAIDFNSIPMRAMKRMTNAFSSSTNQIGMRSNEREELCLRYFSHRDKRLAARRKGKVTSNAKAELEVITGTDYLTELLSRYTVPESMNGDIVDIQFDPELVRKLELVRRFGVDRVKEMHSGSKSRYIRSRDGPEGLRGSCDGKTAGPRYYAVDSDDWS